jgi:hypothetical protein
MDQNHADMASSDINGVEFSTSATKDYLVTPLTPSSRNKI